MAHEDHPKPADLDAYDLIDAIEGDEPELDRLGKELDLKHSLISQLESDYADLAARLIARKAELARRMKAAQITILSPPHYLSRNAVYALSPDGISVERFELGMLADLDRARHAAPVLPSLDSYRLTAEAVCAALEPRDEPEPIDPPASWAVGA